MSNQYRSWIACGALVLGQLSAACDDEGDGVIGGAGSPGSGATSGTTSGGAGTVEGGTRGSSAGTTGTSAGTSSAGTSSAGTSSAGTSSGGSGDGASGTSAGGSSGAGGASGGGGGSGGGAGGSGGAGGTSGSGGAAGDAAAAMLTDAQIVGVLDTLNLGEVTEAQSAQPRLMTEDARNFAQEMITEHGAARQEVSTTAATLMLQPADSSVQTSLKAASDARVAAVTNAPAEMADEVYLSGQIVAHASAVALLNQLAGAADAEPLGALITTLRGDVEDHLDEAMMLTE